MVVSPSNTTALPPLSLSIPTPRALTGSLSSQVLWLATVGVAEGPVVVQCVDYIPFIST